MKLREINLYRTLPVCIAASLIVQAVIEKVLSVQGSHPAWDSLLALAITGVICLQVRLGRLPWLETKNGEKQQFIVWLEKKLPFLRADFYRKW